MSDAENQMTDLMKKIGICNKNVKALMEMVKTLTDNQAKPVEKTPEEKERIEKAFEKRGLGRPSGSWESKRLQYFKMLSEKKIAQPKEATLLYYKIFKDMSNDKYILLDN